VRLPLSLILREPVERLAQSGPQPLAFGVSGYLAGVLFALPPVELHVPGVASGAEKAWDYEALPKCLP